ncbi:HlyD family type I secretion periplasmic adaptor subunit [Marinobacter halodurans]|uniref:Membrane fusion protein (MFP) family protein n=1 Tax=Marinobacter halodurans TaxID=2528979 RepID=A0ABY1ZGQ4_9GAMM|nr:HlyD family type I secretion periplasmic adaptor subunit [Marinobacter halodurans]TBW48118.1 HlyD family type I secretion periplasmic adaptor subunit [Marinobacter halodurans]
MKIFPLKKKDEKRDALSQKDILEFMPAAIEIEKTPASPVGRVILYVIILLFVIAGLWATFGKIDIVATAGGKIVPNERIKVIQPLETASVAVIHVEEGQEVKKGDPLITLNTSLTQADVRRLQQEWTSVAVQVIRLQALANWFEQPLSEAPTIRTGDKKLAFALPEQQYLLNQEVNEIYSRLGGFSQEARRLNAERDMAEAELSKNERLLAVLGERVNAYEVMLEKQLGSRMDYLEVKQQQIEVEENVAVQRARIAQLEASIQASKFERQTFTSEHYKQTLDQLQQVRVQAASLFEEKAKAQQRDSQYRLKAPIGGQVQQLDVHTIGGVVTPAQPLMVIVPEQGTMEVEALVLNKDIGFVHEGQNAEVKIDTFNFTKYGVIDAEILSLSDDAIQHEELGLVYSARIKLRQDGLQVENRWVKLSPGMSVVVEIKTGKRRLIEYFLSPLLRYKQESVRER